MKAVKPKKRKQKGKKPQKKLNLAPLKRELRTAFVNVCSLLLLFAGMLGIILLAMYVAQWLGLTQ